MNTNKRAFGLSIILLLMLIVSLTASLFYKEPWLWMDETLSYTLLSDPSFAHLQRAIVSNLDANPPLFYYLYWPIAQLTSVNPIALKIVSIVLFALTIAFFYRYTTRFVGTPTTNFLLFTLLISFTYLNYTLAAQMRSYCLYLLISGLFFVTAHQLIHAPTRPIGLVAHLATGLALMLTHNFGSFYVAASLGYFGLLFLWSKQRAYLLVVGVHGLVIGLWALLWFGNFQIQSQAGKPHSWVPIPTFQSAFRTLGELIPSVSNKLEQTVPFLPMLRVALVVGLFLYVALPRLRAGYRSVLADKAFSFYLMSGFIMISVGVVALVTSYTYVSVFVSRYQWPSHLLLLFQAVYAYQAFAPTVRLSPRWRLAVLLYSGLLAGFMFYQSKKVSIFPSGILSYLPQLDAKTPVFFESADYFLPIWHHRQANAHYLLNWESAVREGNLPNATLDFKVISSLRDYYGVNQVISTNEFVKQQVPHFYVVDEASRYQIEQFIANKQVRVLRVIPVSIEGHRILECKYATEPASQNPVSVADKS